MNKLLILFLLLPLNLFGQWERSVKFLDSQGQLIKEYKSQVTDVVFKTYDYGQCHILYTNPKGESCHTPLISDNPETPITGQKVYHWNGATIQSLLRLQLNEYGTLTFAHYQEMYRGKSSKIITFTKVK
jgi:hypothetical protein